MGRRHFGARLYLRIWFAMLAGMLLTAVLALAAWRLGADHESRREVALTDAAGSVVGRALIDFHESPGAARVELDDGRVLFARWRDARPGSRGPGFLISLALIVAAIGVVAYPIARRLTRRLERLQTAVDALGEGDLGARVEVRGHDEVARLAKHFNHAAERIEALVAAHKDLLANASHELRSPLARIRMGLELLERGEHRRAIDEISRDIAELDLLIEEILTASRLDIRDTHDEPFERFDLTALAAEECARADATLEARGVVVAHGSIRLVRRALRNLLENARRHGGSATPVEVSVELLPAGIDICVSDHGPGIPVTERERVFEPFYRLPGASEADGGAGLGLALVRKIARLHGGDARCEARAGGGATFRISLPAPVLVPVPAPGVAG